MADTKHSHDQIRVIHENLNQYDGEEALERIRNVLYPPLTNDSDNTMSDLPTKHRKEKYNE